MLVFIVEQKIDIIVILDVYFFEYNRKNEISARKGIVELYGGVSIEE